MLQIGLCGVVEADLELFCNSWSAGFLRERLYIVSGAPLENGVFAAAGRDTLCRRRRRRAAVGAPAYRGAKGAACYPRGWARAVSKTHAPADRRDESTNVCTQSVGVIRGLPSGFSTRPVCLSSPSDAVPCAFHIIWWVPP